MTALKRQRDGEKRSQLIVTHSFPIFSHTFCLWKPLLWLVVIEIAKIFVEFYQICCIDCAHNNFPWIHGSVSSFSISVPFFYAFCSLQYEVTECKLDFHNNQKGSATVCLNKTKYEFVSEMCVRCETDRCCHHCTKETCLNLISVVWCCFFDAVCLSDFGISDLILGSKVAPLWSIHFGFYIPVFCGIYNTVAMLGHIFTALCQLLDVKAQAVC